MPTRTVPVLALVLLLVPLGGAAQSVRPPSNPLALRDATGGEVKGTGVIRGRVTSLESGKPLRRARIQLNSPVLLNPRTVSTNSDGRYEIRELPPGRYTLTVTRSGYLPLSFGQRRPGEPGKPFELADKQVAERVDVALPRMGVISGRVVDELGEPIAGVNVWGMQVAYFQGARRLVPITGGLHGSTDDTGQYRLIALPPGDYVVMAQSRETWPLDDDPKQVFTYAPSYYPGTPSPTDAQRVKVATGQEVTGVDFALTPMRTARVSGTLLSASGTPLAGEAVSLGYSVSGPAGGSVFGGASAKTNADGSFTLMNVPPAEYQLAVRVPPRSDQPSLQASQPLVVSGTDIEGLVVIAGAGGTIRGQLVTDDDSALPSNVDRLLVTAQSLMPGPRLVLPGNQDSGRVTKEGTFAISGVFGPSLLNVAFLTGEWTVKNVELEGREIADESLDVGHGDNLSGIRIVLTTKPTMVRGGLTDEKRQPVEGTVIVFPEESSRWRDGSRAIRSARPDQNGEFSVKGLPPGEYMIAAVDYVQDGQWNDPEFLEALRRRAERFALAEAETKRVDLILKN